MKKPGAFLYRMAASMAAILFFSGAFAGGTAHWQRGPGWMVAVPPAAPLTPEHLEHADHRAFHVDADQGNDSALGTLEHPWKTLRRAAQAHLQAGDSLLLKCGSLWRESLLLHHAFAPDGHVRIAAYGACTSMRAPMIRGSDAIAPEAWQPAIPGSTILVAQTAPLQRLFQGGQPLVRARYPNSRGIGNEFALTRETGTRTRLRVDSKALAAIGRQPLRGASIYVRTEPWRVEVAKVDDFDPESGWITLDHPLSITIGAGVGYILEGQRWMLDAPGEWFYDADSGQTLLWPLASRTVLSIEGVTRNNGIAADDIDHLQIDGIAIEQTTQAAVMLKSTPHASLSHLQVRHGRQYGIWLQQSPDSEVTTSLVEGAAWSGIRLEGDRGVLTHDTVRETGLYSLPETSDSALSVEGRDVRVADNLVEHAANLGIRFTNLPGVLIEHNIVLFPCSRLTDCGGIYTWTADYPTTPSSVPPSGAQVRANVVAGVHGNLEGTGGRGSNRACGIYLDALSTGIAVMGNSLSNAELGIFLHNAQANDIIGNTVWNITHASFSAHQTRNDVEVIRANRISGNLLMSHEGYRLTASGEPEASEAHALEWEHPREGAQFFQGSDANRVADNIELSVSATGSPTWLLTGQGRRALLAESGWRAIAGRDRATAPVGYRPMRVAKAGPSLVRNGLPSRSLAPWSGYFDPAGQGVGSLTLVRHPSCGGSCVRFVAGTASDLMSSNTFELDTTPGHNLYVLEYTAIGGSHGGLRKAMVRRAVASWDSAGLNQAPQVLIEGQRVRVQQLFAATVAAPVRLDFYGKAGGETLIEDISLAPVSTFELADFSRLTLHAINATDATVTLACQDTGLSSCDAVDAEGHPVRWPLSVPAHSSRIVLSLDPTWRR